MPAGHPEPSHPAIESGGQISGLGERSSRRAEEPGGGGEVADGVVFDPCADDRTALLACFGPPEAHCNYGCKQSVLTVVVLRGALKEGG